MKFSSVRLKIIVLVILGLLTVFMGGSVIFNLFGIRQLEGRYVSFIVWANFICGILYIVSAYGCLKQRPWTLLLMLLAVLILVFAFGALLIYISAGHPYENKTLVAMVFRIAATLWILVSLRRSIIKEGVEG